MAAATLHIYDVSTNPDIAKLNKYLTAVGTGAFHGAIEVYGKEWSYGFTEEGTGIFQCKPKQCEMHHYRESIELGETQMSEEAVLSLISEMEPNWPGSDYDLLRRNCVIFTAEFAKRLGVKDVPRWVTNLAGAGATIQDGAMQAATKAQALAIIAAAKAGEINAKYDISGQAAAKVQDLLRTAAELDEQYHIKAKATEAAEQAGKLATKGTEQAAEAAKKAIFKVKELAEKHQVKEKANMAKQHAQVAIEGARQHTEGLCGPGCVVQ